MQEVYCRCIMHYSNKVVSGCANSPWNTSSLHVVKAGVILTAFHRVCASHVCMINIGQEKRKKRRVSSEVSKEIDIYFQMQKKYFDL